MSVSPFFNGCFRMFFRKLPGYIPACVSHIGDMLYNIYFRVSFSIKNACMSEISSIFAA